MDYAYTRDHLGSVREVVASDGTTVVSRLSYDPWGKVTETGSVLSDFTYTGHLYDRPTGLSLAWYRGYDANLGRWLSKDPIGLKGGLNPYGYVDNDPINATDPTGLAKVCNNTKKTIYGKDENDLVIVAIPPGECRNVDGFYNPGGNTFFNTWDGYAQFRKLNDLTDVAIYECTHTGGKPDYQYSGPFSMLADLFDQMYRGDTWGAG